MMATQEHELKQENITRPVAEMISALLPVVARKKAAQRFPVQAGASYFYDVAAGWETDALRQDEKVVQIKTISALDDAFADPTIKMMLIPFDASVTKAAALQVCRRNRQGKTIFYEVKEDE